MRILGIVTARGGSKGIPRKNLAPLLGQPLLAYTAQAALASQLTRVVLSTDCPEIAAVGEKLGLEVPFLRPAELAADDTPTLPVLQDVVRRLADQGDEYDGVFILQPTNPLRLVSDIDGAIELLITSGADSVISFVPVGERHPARMKQLDPQRRVVNPPFAEQFEGQRRQDLPPYYLRDGSVYVTRMTILMEQNSIQGTDCRAWLMPVERAWNVDEPFDLFMVEQLLRYQQVSGE
ncbi:MAG: acylneuraminate cytidylyltransferase family protein [Pirellulales bacterium]|nr:acylneuraminate cytidylyltransferase family protein [Pirellulales bacterium]